MYSGWKGEILAQLRNKSISSLWKRRMRQYGFKNICKDGNCFDKNGNPHEVQEFTFECNGNSIQNGEVNANELNDLFDSTTGPQP